MPAAGGEGMIIEFPDDAVSGKRISAHEREVSYAKGGKAVYTVRRVSADGKDDDLNLKGHQPSRPNGGCHLRVRHTVMAEPPR